MASTGRMSAALQAGYRTAIATIETSMTTGIMKTRGVMSARQIGCHIRDEAFFTHYVERKSLECEVEQHGFVLQVIELLSRHPGAGFEIYEIELFGECEVIRGIEVEAFR